MRYVSKDEVTPYMAYYKRIRDAMRFTEYEEQHAVDDAKLARLHSKLKSLLLEERQKSATAEDADEDDDSSE